MLDSPKVSVEPNVSNHFAWMRTFMSLQRTLMAATRTAIVGERLTRTDLDTQLHALTEPIPAGLLTRCNINSIAEATGINRETARRKVHRLIDAGLIERGPDGSIGFASGFAQRPEPGAVMRTQLETITRTANELLRDGVLSYTEATPP